MGSRSSSRPTRNRLRGLDYADTADVQNLHAAIRREKREPRAGLEPLSVWLLAVYALTVFIGGFYLARYAGDFSATGLNPSNSDQPDRRSPRQQLCR